MTAGVSETIGEAWGERRLSMEHTGLALLIL
jgi:hypothetical protein